MTRHVMEGTCRRHLIHYYNDQTLRREAHSLMDTKLIPATYSDLFLLERMRIRLKRTDIITLEDVIRLRELKALKENKI